MFADPLRRLFPSVRTSRAVDRYVLHRRYASKSFAPTPPNIVLLESPSDMGAARQWTDAFRRVSIPREAVELTFSRSSGPGGQNVNKVNTKCTAKCPLRSPFIPPWAKETLRRNVCPSYATTSDSLVVCSTLHRSQARNVDDCLRKLHSLIISAALSNVRNETSEEQKKRVEVLKKVEKARRRQEKDYQSKKNQSRKIKDWE